MPVYKEEDVSHLSDEEKKELHLWCWGNDFGDCDHCALRTFPSNKETQHGSE
jgi:hypothetical protein